MKTLLAFLLCLCAAPVFPQPLPVVYTYGVAIDPFDSMVTMGPWAYTRWQIVAYDLGKEYSDRDTFQLNIEYSTIGDGQVKVTTTYDMCNYQTIGWLDKTRGRDYAYKHDSTFRTFPYLVTTYYGYPHYRYIAFVRNDPSPWTARIKSVRISPFVYAAHKRFYDTHGHVVGATEVKDLPTGLFRESIETTVIPQK